MPTASSSRPRSRSRSSPLTNSSPESPPRYPPHLPSPDGLPSHLIPLGSRPRQPTSAATPEFAQDDWDLLPAPSAAANHKGKERVGYREDYGELEGRRGDAGREEVSVPMLSLGRSGPQAEDDDDALYLGGERGKPSAKRRAASAAKRRRWFVGMMVLLGGGWAVMELSREWRGALSPSLEVDHLKEEQVGGKDVNLEGDVLRYGLQGDGGVPASSEVPTMAPGASAASPSMASPSSRPATGVTTGGDGSTITKEDGTTFVYRNRFGGSWDSSSSGASARAQSWSPPLSEHWDYANARIFGMNLGGWLTLEPFITPALYEPFMDDPTPAVDEWTLSENLGSSLAETITEHYKTFITEEDFAQIADAGMNWVRIPLPFWAVDARDDEPFLGHVAWQYLLKAVGWARKYGLRINLDLHTVPGSQNGWNHSGKMGPVNLMRGVMGVYNAQRTLNIIRLLTEFICLPENIHVIPMFGILNEPVQNDIGTEPIRRFYYEAYEMIRNITGFGVGNGPMITIHDGFQNPTTWHGFMEGADRIALDSHYYLVFMPPNRDPISSWADKPCTKWAAKFNETNSKFGVATAGEWSFAVNDCGRFLNGVNAGSRYDGTFPTSVNPDFEGVGSCEGWDDPAIWDEERKKGLREFALGYMDATRNFFFWTWKTGPTRVTNKTSNPQWSYKLGLGHGYAPKDPRTANGFCLAHAAAQGLRPPKQFKFRGEFLPHQTGGAPTVSVVSTQRALWSGFPGSTLSGGLDVRVLPTLTATGSRLAFPSVPTDAPVTASSREGSRDWYTQVEGCEYTVGAWDGVDVPVPTAGCAGTRTVSPPTGTPATKAGMRARHLKRSIHEHRT